MKKEQRKKMMNIIVIIVTVGMLASLFAGITLSGSKNKAKDAAVSVENNEAIVAEIKDAEFGSIVKIGLTDKGKGQYKDAATYELFDEKGQMSRRVSLGTEATIFPAMKPENKVDIRIYTKDNKEIASIKASFVQWK